jgi:hypothetical protein
MAMPQEVEGKVSADIESKEEEITGIIFSKIENLLLAKEVVSKLFAYEMKEGVETLLISCHKYSPASTEYLSTLRGEDNGGSKEKFDQVLIFNPFIEDENKWKARLRNIVENNLNLGGNLFIVDSKINQDPRCAEIKPDVIRTLLEENRINKKEGIGRLEMDNVGIGGIKDFVVVLRAKNCKLPNLPKELPKP